jgi:hypothetical protein
VVHLKNELWKNLAFIGMNARKNEIGRTDHPELYYTIGRQFDVLIELINGPCRANQELFMKPITTEYENAPLTFNSGDIEIILKMCRRNMNDLNSGFINLQTKACTFLLAFFEGNYKESIDLIADILDPNKVFKLLINYTKRLYLHTLYNTPEKTMAFMADLKQKGLLKEPVESMIHYKKKKFEIEEGQEISGDPNKVADASFGKSLRENRSKRAKNKISTVGDEIGGDLFAGGGYNFWMEAPKQLITYLLTNYKIDSTEKLLAHYKLSEEFCKHKTLQLILKLYALLKTFDSNFKFRGYMKKKTEDMKRHYYMQSNVSALCTNEEIEIFKQSEVEEIPEETTIFTFLADIVRAVEVINNEGTCTWAYYPKNPKVFYLTQNSIKNFRAECRIDQATTKVMDLMAYVKQFDIEMSVNYHLNQKYRMLAM